MSTRRESAHALVQRLNAASVSLLPPIFQSSTEGGLRQNDVLFVGGVPGSGKTTWTYRVAAQHLILGGAVTFVFLPGSGNFQMRRFMEQVEIFAKEGTASSVFSSCYCDPSGFLTGSSVQTAHASVMEARREVLLGVLERLEVVHCIDVTDLAVYCEHGRVNTSASARCGEAVVPLVILEGCGGRGSYIHYYERAIGHEVPLFYWLFGHLQRRKKCALILTEDWGPAAGGGSSECRFFARGGRLSSSLLEVGVEEESDFLSRLRSEIVRPSNQWKKKPVRRSRGLASSSADAQTAGFLPTLTTEEPFYFVGGMRLFYLCTQAVQVSSICGVVPVAQLMRWRPVERDADDEGGEGDGATENASRAQQRWRVPHMRGEALCAAQL